MSSYSYENRALYRGLASAVDPCRRQLDRFEITVCESNLQITCEGRGLRERARTCLVRARAELERFMSLPESRPFAVSLRPVSLSGYPLPIPGIATRMASAGSVWNVGPMAAVAGAIAECVARELARVTKLVIVENGGDIFAFAPDGLIFSIYPGECSPFSPDQLRFRVDASRGIGVCTSSGTVGPSLSFGSADAVVTIASDGSMADAAATSIANLIQGPGDIDPRLFERSCSAGGGGLLGLVVCAGDRLGVYGEVRLAGDREEGKEGSPKWSTRVHC